MKSNIILSIGIPAYNRPKWLKRAIKSVIDGNHSELNNVEIIVSDDSSNSECREVTEEVLQEWNGNWKYVANSPRLGMAENWNQAIELASGRYILILHDDDYILPNAISNIIKTIQLINQERAVLLFGVKIVDQDEKSFKKQVFHNREYLSPSLALKSLLKNSSFVRFPAIVISRQIFEEVGYFNTSIGGVADIDMWSRIFGKFGVYRIPITTCAYTVHPQALTDGMFQLEVIQKLTLIFERVEELNILSTKELLSYKSSFFHQFILAGTYRKIIQKRFSDAREVMKLFKAYELSEIEISIKWLPIRLLFNIVTIGIYFFEREEKEK